MYLMNRKRLLLLSAGLSACLSSFAQIEIDFSEEVGEIKLMNAVNNGPVVEKKVQKSGNFRAYSDAGFPYARLHDAPIRRDWAHTVDVSCVFPDFSADEEDPRSYDFTLTDKLLKEIQASGTKVFYRLGQSIEHWPKKYDVMPPADFRKWARICEHIVLHYNYGWADGFNMGIEYWEIWNEPDLGHRAGRHLRNDSPTWNGSDTDFFRFYETAYRHLKKCFPELKFGGPALCEDNEWAERFLEYMSSKRVGLDFFSYHLYAGTAGAFQKKNALMKELLDRYGYGDVEMILDEWNYLSNWTDEFVYTLETVQSHKGAAFTAAVMSVCQDGPADMLMYYDARPGTGFNGLFAFSTSKPLPAYYAMYSWKKLLALGTQVRSTAGGLEDIYVTAAKGEDGRNAALITYYTDDRDPVAPVRVTVDFRGCRIREAVGHITDKNHLHTEVPVHIIDGKAELFLEVNSYIFIETR